MEEAKRIQGRKGGGEGVVFGREAIIVFTRLRLNLLLMASFSAKFKDSGEGNTSNK
ncbi:MAG: hypothetical protein M3162_06295 [Thermoproteota archaeon]|nr:hypothetical protein [Thermoproteota archaeon]